VIEFENPESKNERGSESWGWRFSEQTIKITVFWIIIIHLLGLAPAGYLAAPDNGGFLVFWGCAWKSCQPVPSDP
jgi:hypothetical protein